MQLDAQSDMSSSPDYYSVLGVERDATAQSIKKAYRTQALKWCVKQMHAALHLMRPESCAVQHELTFDLLNWRCCV